MNKSELIKRLSDKFLIDSVKTGDFVEAVFSSITDSLKKGKNINIVKFGRFNSVLKNVSGAGVRGVSYSPVKKFAEEVNYPYEHLPHVKIKSIEDGYIEDLTVSQTSEINDENVFLDFTDEIPEEQVIKDYEPTATKEVTDEKETPDIPKSYGYTYPEKEKEAKRELLPDSPAVPQQTVFLDSESSNITEKDSEELSAIIDESLIKESDEISDNLVKLLEERERILEDIERLERDILEETDNSGKDTAESRIPVDDTPVFTETPVFEQFHDESKSNVFEELPSEDSQTETGEQPQDEKAIYEELPPEDRNMFEERPPEEKAIEELHPEVKKGIDAFRDSESDTKSSDESMTMREIEERLDELEHLVFDDSDKTVADNGFTVLSHKDEQETPEIKTEETKPEKEILSSGTRVFEKLSEEKEEKTESRQILGDELKALHEDIEKEPLADSAIQYIEEKKIDRLEDAFEEKTKTSQEEKITDTKQSEKIKDYSDVFTPMEHLQKFGSYPPMVINDKPVDKRIIIKGFLFIMLIIVALLIMISIYEKIGQKTQQEKDTVNVTQNIIEQKSDTAATPDGTVSETPEDTEYRIIYTESDATFWQTPEGIIIQVASYETLDEAQAKVETLREKEINARVIPYKSEEEIVNYRVITGPYEELDEAKTAYKNY